MSASCRGWALVGLLAALLACLVLGLCVGTRSVDMVRLVEALMDHGVAVSSDDRYVVWSMRGPRTLVAAAVGAALGCSGALVQALTRNPLCDTGILGVNAGAALAVTLGVGLLGIDSIQGLAGCAFAGALATTVAVHLLGASGRAGADPLRLVLAGLALGAVVSGVADMLVLGDPDTFEGLREWSVGSLANRTLAHLVPLLGYLAAGFLLAAGQARNLDALALGDEVAAAQGVRLQRSRILVVVAITLLAGCATALCGPIGFVGLMVPHVVRWFVSPSQQWLIPLSALAGACLLVLADVVGRVVVAPAEMPVGVVTAFIGAPALVVLVRTRRRVSGL